MRICPFGGCLKEIPQSLFACRKHWGSLNSKERAEVWAIYDSWLNEEIGWEEVRQRQQSILGVRGTA